MLEQKVDLVLNNFCGIIEFSKNNFLFTRAFTTKKFAFEVWITSSKQDEINYFLSKS